VIRTEDHRVQFSHLLRSSARLLVYSGVIFLGITAQTALAAAGAGAPAGAASSSVTEAQMLIPNMSVVEPGLFRGGQPNAAALMALAKLGVKTDICLDNEQPLIDEERRAAQEAGLNFVSISLNPLHRPTDHEISHFLDMVQDHDQNPVFVHCVHGRDRTSAMIGIYRVVKEGWSADDAYREMLTRGFRPIFTHLSDAVFDYGKQAGHGGHRPSMFYVATHLTGDRLAQGR
jgi:protein tyrosine phosphatase (PTP) superfamily phosphohydrolase (DUF442 family)